MKKIFPIIIILITLSLVGIILIQVSWFSSMLENKEDELKMHINTSIGEVGDQLTAETNITLPSLKSSLKPTFNWPSDQMLKEFMKPSTVASRYTEFMVNESLRKSFDKNGLRGTPFEFAVILDVSLMDYEMKSKGFINLLKDTARNLQVIYPIQVPSGTTLEGLIPAEYLIVMVPNVKHIVLTQLRWMIAGASLFVLILVAAFYVTVSALLRQKKLSEIKNDFINNMTHEFKTPLATISLAVDALRNEKVMNDKTKLSYFSGVIKEENKRMNKQVETILQAALSDRQDIQLNLKPIHVHEIIRHALDNFNLQLEERGAKANLLLNARHDVINADEVHFTNLISNLVDNAIKYSKENLVVNITTHSSHKSVVIRVEDNGIGMNKETAKRIFEKFYRAHTGNVHNVKGFGLGLSYVKSIVDVHQGKIRVDSILGKGTAFTIDIPLMKG